MVAPSKSARDIPQRTVILLDSSCGEAILGESRSSTCAAYRIAMHSRTTFFRIPKRVLILPPERSLGAQWRDPRCRLIPQALGEARKTRSLACRASSANWPLGLPQEPIRTRMASRSSAWLVRAPNFSSQASSCAAGGLGPVTMCTFMPNSSGRARSNS